MSLPQRLGRLRQVSRLGSGGFATVWLYQDPELDSQVAVKALADNWASRSDIRDRFLDEARMLRRADSDHVVRVYDIGVTEDDTPYFVMTYADQGTVADLLVGEPVEVDEVVRLVAEAGQGLSRLHELGILHRDVKPQNLLMRTDHHDVARVLVADLGVAKASLHASGITQVVGTPAYMAPEQADPTAGVDQRADVHALGAVAYHLLTGRQLRPGGIESLLTPSEPERPSEVDQSVPTAVDTVILKAVSHDREQRWSDVHAFTEALSYASRSRTLVNAPGTAAAADADAGTIAGSPMPASGSPPPLDQPQGTSRRRRLVPVLIALLLVVLVVAGVGAWKQWGPGDDPTHGAATKTPLAMTVGSGWHRDADRSTTSRTTYQRDDADVHLRLDDNRIDAPPSVAGPLELRRASAAKNFKKLVSRPLPASERGPWQEGWELKYAWTGADGYRHEWLAWYLGNARESAGLVGIYAGEGDTKNYHSLLVRARKQVFP